MTLSKPASLLLAATLLAATAPWAAGMAQTLSEKAAKDETVKVQDGDPAMAAAFAHARATLPDFVKTLQHPAPGMRAFAVKVGLPASNGTEFVWLSSPSLRDGQVQGVLSNTPEFTTAYHEGQRVQFPQSAVVDWMYLDSGRMKGNFTACAIASKLSQQERQQFEQEYKIDCAAQQ